MASHYSYLLDDMTWSYSRLKAFDDCKYRWFLKYIRQEPSRENFFATFGKFCHELLESYYKGEVSKEDLSTRYLTGFYRSVAVDDVPNQKIFTNYFQSGLAHFSYYQPLPYNVLAVEKKVEFKLYGLPFVGYIDVLGKNNSGLLIIDHKSRALKPRSTKGRVTKTDVELDEYLRQLYLYSRAILQETTEYPKELIFNCFRTNTIIEEKWKRDRQDDAVEWAIKKIDDIYKEEDFKPDVDFFKCKYLCEMRDSCEYAEMNFGKM